MTLDHIHVVSQINGDGECVDIELHIFCGYLVICSMLGRECSLVIVNWLGMVGEVQYGTIFLWLSPGRLSLLTAGNHWLAQHLNIPAASTSCK